MVKELPGIIGKDVDKDSVLYNVAREEVMAVRLEQIASTGRQVIFPVGAAHEKNLGMELKRKGIKVETSPVQAEESARLQPEKSTTPEREVKASWTSKVGVPKSAQEIIEEHKNGHASKDDSKGSKHEQPSR